MPSTVVELLTLRDFEVIWTDPITNIPKEMVDVSMEIYHYEGPTAPKIKVPLSEPYIFTETINDTVNIGAVKPSESVLIDVHITLELNLIENSLDSLLCPPNNFVVPFTHHKVSIVNGYKKYALSACELAALINLQASGYVASSEDGFLVLEGDYYGSDSRLQIGNGTFNSTVGLVLNSQYFGQDLGKHIDLFVNPMEKIETGTYVVSSVNIIEPVFSPGERYFVVYRGKDANSNIEEMRKEDFTVLNPSPSGITTSFLK